MCGQYYLDMLKHKELKKIINRDIVGDIFPGKLAPVIIKKDNQYQMKMMKWGYPMKDKLIYNARMETVLEKDFFISIYTQRCLIPISGYYEWTPTKEKYAFTLGKPFYLAGIYQNDHFCILTTPANQYVEHIHHRMPLILKNKNIDLWLSDHFEKCLSTQQIQLTISPQ